MSERATARGACLAAGVLAAALGCVAGCRGGAPGSGMAASTPSSAGETRTASTPPASTPVTERPGPDLAMVRISPGRGPDAIPGVPVARIPDAGRSPFRLAQLGRTAQATPWQAPGGARGTGSPQPDPAPTGLAPLPPAPGGALTASLPPAPGFSGAGAPVRVASARQEAGAGAAATPRPVSLLLTGVIEGSPVVAVIEGEKKHYIVQEGDRVAGSYTVASISLQRVVLRSEDSSLVILRLGGRRG